VHHRDSERVTVMKKEETVVDVLLSFLQGEEAKQASLISKKGEGGKVVLSSYGVPIAELKEGKVVIKYKYSQRKHSRWLRIISQEKGIRVESDYIIS
jgi:hypothetical protein